MSATLTVGALARRANVTTKTVRYYESLGLLPRASRGDNGYRYYPHNAVERLTFIRRAKQLGLSLGEISDLISRSEDGMCNVISPELQRMLERKIAEFDRQLTEIAAFRQTLATAANQLATCADDTISTCGSCSAFAATCGCMPVSTDLAFQATT